MPTGWSFSACAQMKTGSCFVVRAVEGGAGHQIVNRDVARAFDRRIHQEHQVGEFRRHSADRRRSRLDQRLGEGGKDDHAAEAVADDHQERVSAALLAGGCDNGAAARTTPAPTRPPRAVRPPAGSQNVASATTSPRPKLRQPAPADKNPKDRTRRDAGRGVRLSRNRPSRSKARETRRDSRRRSGRRAAIHARRRPESRPALAAQDPALARRAFWRRRPSVRGRSIAPDRRTRRSRVRKERRS